VTRVYTERAVFLITEEGVRVRETFGISFEDLQGLVDVPLLPAA
jgi:3-oxoadipate CoA-transferase beta subunit